MKSPSNYGTIPTTTTTTATATQTHAPPTFISRATAQTQTLTSAIRPWRTFLDPHFLSTPLSYPEALTRLKTNVHHFRFNYALILLITLFLTLIYHPLSMIAFLAVFVLWVFVYFFREGPVVLSRWTVDDRVVFCVLICVTVIVLEFTKVGLNVLVGLVIGVLVIALHAGFRGIDDLFMDEDDAVEGDLVTFSRG